MVLVVVGGGSSSSSSSSGGGEMGVGPEEVAAASGSELSALALEAQILNPRA